MMEGAFSTSEKEAAIEALRAIGLAQQNASLLLKELRGKCKQHGMDAEFLRVQAAFMDAERVAAQELRKLLVLAHPLTTPERAVEDFRADVAAGEPESVARERLEEVRQAWTAPQMRAAGDHTFEEVTSETERART